MLKKNNMTKEDIKKYFEENFLTLPKKIQTKIFLFKMKFFYPELKQKIFYTSLKNLSAGLFGQSQLFTIGKNIYFYSPTPFQYKFRKVLGIYIINKQTFMIFQTPSGYYELSKDSFTLHILFLSFKDAKNYMELNYAKKIY